ncbi:RHS repeat-associated core domain-containing protein [Pseudomonas juntendi]|uniref:RHS repeat-associated core domain-containing protein n=1 Tax=Pseudomonas juntendi TaxID=2666183 RepID=A0A7W2JNP7_9PSED|nr:RHS repeat-associated core domain-containing protein [Pseudomonas juntendi]MBA6062280.1 RHS repeat-associated core domain-containing protein [Pseudomonas juntendi]MBA6129118.1 RHS repeat-associated core domain-containing protein [Pseudomonas juntendi]
MDSVPEGGNCSEQNTASLRQSARLITGSSHQGLGYTPYGYQATTMSLLGFNGDRLDPASGYYPLGNGHRSFSTSLMRFISPDRMSPFATGGLNSYAYCLGDPINRHDPSGENSVVRSFVKLYRRLIPKKLNLPPIVNELASAETETHFISYRNIPDEYRINVVNKTDRVPDDYDLIGFHGSQNKHKQSLEAGVNASLLKRDLLGKGLYASTNYRHANKYAGKDGRIFAVYGRGIERWRVGVQFDRPGPDILLIRPPTFSNIIVRSEVRMPLRLLHQLNGDTF